MESLSSKKGKSLIHERIFTYTLKKSLRFFQRPKTYYGEPALFKTFQQEVLLYSDETSEKWKRIPANCNDHNFGPFGNDSFIWALSIQKSNQIFHFSEHGWKDEHNSGPKCDTQLRTAASGRSRRATSSARARRRSNWTVFELNLSAWFNGIFFLVPNEKNLLFYTNKNKVC